MKITYSRVKNHKGSPLRDRFTARIFTRIDGKQKGVTLVSVNLEKMPSVSDFEVKHAEKYGIDAEQEIDIYTEMSMAYGDYVTERNVHNAKLIFESEKGVHGTFDSLVNNTEDLETLEALAQQVSMLRTAIAMKMNKVVKSMENQENQLDMNI